MGDALLQTLKQENHELLQKLRLAESMELAYQDEIEHLKDALQAAQAKNTNPTRSECNHEDAIQLQERLEQAEEQIHSLKFQLDASERQREVLQERLVATESLLEKNTFEPSLCNSLDLSNPDPAILMEEILHLKDDLSKSEATAQTTQSKLERQLAEIEEDRAILQSHVGELERHLKVTRDELSDVRAQLEAIESQENSTEKTRGNSVFSELEDRRIRAEKLVLQQRHVIEELRLSIKKTEAEANRKLLETVRKLEIRFHERDTKFVDELVAERARLLSENAQLTRRVQQTEELQLDNERNAVKMSKAFSLEGSCQENLIKSLERRISLLQRRLTERSAVVDGLRERLLSASLLRRQMQTELWRQIDCSADLAKRNEELRKLLLDEQGKQADSVISSQLSDMAIKDSKQILVESSQHALHNPADETVQTTALDSENKLPGKGSESTKLSPEDKEPKRVTQLRTASEVQKIELPSECRTS